MMELHQSSPRKIPQEIVIFVLSGTVVCVKVRIGFPKPVIFQKVMYVADGGVGAFPSASRLIYKKVHLL